MHLLYCDETNLEQKSGDFFVYGGLMLPGDNAAALSNEIEEKRRRSGLSPNAELKFNPKPKKLWTHEKFKSLKSAVIEAAINHGCTFIATLTLHDVAIDPEEARLRGINTVCYNFDCLLHRRRDQGLVLIDRFDRKQLDQHLREKFSVGVKGLPYSNKLPLERVLGFHYSAIGQSHFSSTLDIILGSFRHSINSFTRRETDKLTGAGTLLRMIAPLFERNDEGLVIELSLTFSPKTVKVPHYRQLYEALRNFLAENDIDAEQQILSERFY